MSILRDGGIMMRSLYIATPSTVDSSSRKGKYSRSDGGRDVRLSGIPDSIVSTKRCMSTSPDVAVRTLSHVTHCKLVIACTAEEYICDSKVSSGRGTLVSLSLGEYVSGVGSGESLSGLQWIDEMSSTSTVVSASPEGWRDTASAALCFAPGTLNL